MKNIIFSTYLLLPLGAYSQGFIENPGHMSYESGVGIISGFHCTAETVEIKIDDRKIGTAFVGTNRLDAKSLCGKEEVGFSYLINFNSLKPGEHRIELLSGSQVFAAATFFTKRSGGQEFIKGAKRRYRQNEFPTPTQGAELIWVESKQNFVISKIESMIPERDISASEKSQLQTQAITYHILPQLERPETFRLIGSPAWGDAFGKFKHYYGLKIVFSYTTLNGISKTADVLCFATWTSQRWDYAEDTCFIWN